MPLSGIIFVGYCQWKYKHKIHSWKMEFKDFLYAFSSGLKTGYSMENAWRAAERDMLILYTSPSEFIEAVQTVSHQMHMSTPIEQAVKDMSEQFPLEELTNFAEVLATAKKSGGNLVQMMDRIATLITEKMEVEQEIQTMIAGKKLEQKILCGMPIFMILFLRISSPEYIGVLYHNLLGIGIVTGSLVGVCFATWLSIRLIEIEV